MEDDGAAIVNHQCKNLLSIDDILYDETRTEYFLKYLRTINDTTAALFLLDVQKYMTHPSYLQAQEIFQQYLKTPSYIFKAAESLITRIKHFIFSDKTIVSSSLPPLDLFSGLQALCRQYVTSKLLPPFFRSSEHFKDLCDSIRTTGKGSITLGQVLANPVYCSHFESFVATELPANQMNSLRFWLDVQMSFLPLIQVSQMTLENFETLQLAVRRIYNRYLGEASETSTTASVVTKSTRNVVLENILAWQNEPFSPAKYATLFRDALQQVLTYFESSAYPRFKHSSTFLSLVIEIQNANHKVLKRASEFRFLLREGVKAFKSVLLIPVTQDDDRTVCNNISQRKCSAALRRLELQNRTVKDETDEIVCAVTFGVVPEGDVASKPCATLGETNFCYKVCSSVGSASKFPDLPDYCTIPFHIIATSSKRHSSYYGNSSTSTTTPKSTIHNFVIPSVVRNDTGGSCRHKVYYGACMTVYKRFEYDDENDDDSVGYLPTYLCVVVDQKNAIDSLRLLVLELYYEHYNNNDSSGIKLPQSVLKNKLLRCNNNQDKTVVDPFLLCDKTFQNVDTKLSLIFKILSVSHVMIIVQALMLEKKIVLVSSSRSKLCTAGEILRALCEPFTWQHPYLPFSPVDYASRILGSGTPALLGIEGEAVLSFTEGDTTSTTHVVPDRTLFNVESGALVVKSSSADSINLEKAIVIDLDSDEIYFPLCDKEGFPRVSDSVIREVEIRITTSLHHSSVVKRDDVMEDDLLPSVSNIMQDFLKTLFQDLGAYVYTFFGGVNEECIVFEKESFLANLGKSDCQSVEFLTAFFNTACFEDYLLQYQLYFRVYNDDVDKD